MNETARDQFNKAIADLTAIIEDTTVEPDIREDCRTIRDVVVNIALMYETNLMTRREAA